MVYILLNAPQILAATFIGLLIGVLWHRLFARAGAASLKRPGLILAALLAEFWLAAILAGALILAPKEAGPWVMAIGSAIVIWAGFVLPVLSVSMIYRGQPVARTVQDNLHWLVVMIGQAMVLQSLGLVPPPA